MKSRKPLIAVVACVAMVAIGWLVVSGGARIVFEKMLTSLVMPYGMAWGVTSVMLFVSVVRKDRVFIAGTLAIWCLLYFGGNGYVACLLMRQLESPYLETNAEAAADASATFDAVVLLGGGTAVRPDGSVQVAKGGDRVVTAARMYNAGSTKKIICTGSLIPAIDRFGLGQADIAKQLLEGLGVDPADVECVTGRTTAEEMDVLAKMFEDDSRIGLLTSAWHLPRAERLANDRGFHPRPVPSDFGSPPDLRPTVRDTLPSAQAADAISRVVKEWLAGAVGR